MTGSVVRSAPTSPSPPLGGRCDAARAGPHRGQGARRGPAGSRRGAPEPGVGSGLRPQGRTRLAGGCDARTPESRPRSRAARAPCDAHFDQRDSVSDDLLAADYVTVVRRIGRVTRRLRWLREHRFGRCGVRCRCERRRIAVEVTQFRAGEDEGMSGRRWRLKGTGGEVQRGCRAPAGAVRTGPMMMQAATKRTREIKAVWDKLKEVRGL